jgi:hypothetical protein
MNNVKIKKFPVTLNCVKIKKFPVTLNCVKIKKVFSHLKLSNYDVVSKLKLSECYQ